jgi:isoleucyl-tRNA synthetase
VALAVGEKIDYVKIKIEQGNDIPETFSGNRAESKTESTFLSSAIYILAKSRVPLLFSGKYEIVEEFKGKDLIGKEYEPLYSFLVETLPEKEKNKFIKSR